MKWLVGLFLVSWCATVWSYLSRDRNTESSSSGDPTVEVVHQDQNTTLHIASFKPRIGNSNEVEYKHVFSMHNDSSTDLVISSTSKSCGCLAANIDRNVIHPDEVAKITLAVHPANVINKDGSLVINLDNNQTMLYRLQTRTFPYVMLDDNRETTISVGCLAPGERYSIKRKLSVHSTAGTVPPELLWKKSSEEKGEETIRCELSDQGAKQNVRDSIVRRLYDLNIELMTGYAPGMHVHIIEFESIQPSDNQYNFSINLIWNVADSFPLNPPRWIVNSEDLESSSQLSREVEISAKGDRGFKAGPAHTFWLNV